MEFVFQNLFKISFSTFNLFFSFVIFLFLLLWYFKIVWYEVLGWNFLGILMLQFSAFVFSILLMLDALNLFLLGSGVYVFFNMFFTWTLAVYFVFLDKDISLYRKILVLSVVLFIVLLSMSSNEVITTVLGSLILVFLFFNVITIFMSNVKSDLFLDFVFFVFVFVLNVLYYFGYSSWLVEFILVLGISIFVVSRVFFLFILSYISLVNYRKNLKVDINSVSNIIEEVYLVWDNLSSYKNSTQKLIFMLNEDTKRIYSYFRYIGSIISNFYDKVQDVKFSFEIYIDDIKSLNDKVDVFLEEVDSLNKNYDELNSISTSLTEKFSYDISFFRNISEEFNILLGNLKIMKQYIQENIGSLENLLVEFSKVIKGISFLEQVSVEGSISSENYGFYILSESFTKLKNYSSSEVEKILKIKSVISHFNTFYYSFTDEISEVQDNFYKVLSFSDTIVNILKNAHSVVSNIKTDLIDKSKFLEFSNDLKREISRYEATKEDLFKSFDVIEDMLSVVEDTSEKISTLATSIVYVVDIMESLGKNFDTMSSSLRNLKREIDSILE